MDLYKLAFILGALICTASGTEVDGYTKIEVPQILVFRSKGYSVNSVAECATKCDTETSFKCRYFIYNEKDSECWISPANSINTGLYEKEGECIHDNGENYRGTISVTENGFTCQHWDSQIPHNHKFNSSTHPDKHLVENFCRNPDGEPRPWCYTTNPSTRWDFCSIRRCISKPSTIVPELTCFTGKGEAYRGSIAVTKSGKRCQRWSSQRPHQHSRTPENYPCKGLENNYCRNPDNEERPWCYTTDPQSRWEYCDVPSCQDEAGGDECIHCSGENYRGTISVTENGFTCQHWDSQEPHNHKFNSSTHPDKHLVENFCRNPDGEPRPWCYTTNPSTRWDFCSIRRCISKPSTIVPELTCFTGKGEAYRGSIAVTKSGKRCQRWSSQWPHQHSRTPENYSCKGLENNYCRNPDNEERPWCYTTDPQSRWEYCDVPSCQDEARP